jgi:hypothetical protein
MKERDVFVIYFNFLRFVRYQDTDDMVLFKLTD